MRQVKIIYYSGTGGTKLAATTLKHKLQNRNCRVTLERIFDNNIPSTETCNLLVLLFPVHAANAPEPVYKWLKEFPEGNGTTAAVISVSGGGEVIINRAARVSSIQLLEGKGYQVNYENSLVMPSNLFVPTPELLAKGLLNVLPRKIDSIAADLLSDKKKRIKPPFIDRCISRICEVEKAGTKSFGKNIRINERCNGCGFCVKICPAGNISIEEKEPVFHLKCNLCTACIYGCPNHALEPGMMKFAILKCGYNLDTLQLNSKTSQQLTREDINSLTKKIVWRGVRKYLLDKNN